MIAGNKETFIVDYFKKKENGEQQNLNTALYYPTLWLANQLKEENLEYIKGLPITKTEDVNNKKVVVSHGSPDRVNEFLLKDDVLKRSDEFTSRFGGDIFIFGHTHLAYNFQKDGVNFINSGAIGAPRQMGLNFPYTIIEFDGNNIKTENILVPFKKDDMVNYFSSYIKDVGFAGQMLLDQIVSGKEAVNIYLSIVKKVAQDMEFEGNIYPEEITNIAVENYLQVMNGKKTLEEVLNQGRSK